MKERALEIASREIGFGEDGGVKSRLAHRATDKRRVLELQAGKIAGIDQAVGKGNVEKIDVAFGKISTDKFACIEGCFVKTAFDEDRKANLAVFEKTIRKIGARKIDTAETAFDECAIEKRGVL